MSTNYPITHIVVHISASPQRGDRAEAVHRWHSDPKPQGNGWDGVGYHYLIGEDGLREVGRPEYWIGSHVGGQNINKIGIMLFAQRGEDITEAQYSELTALCREILGRWPGIEICGHSDLDPIRKANCPGFDVQQWAVEQCLLR